MTLQGIFCNCKGLKKKGVSTFLKNLISEYKFHFIGLQETMVRHCDDNIIRKFDAPKDYLWFCNPSKGKSRGILVAIRNEFYDVGSFHQGEFMLQLNLWDKVNKIKWNLLVVYGAAQDENKVKFLSELSVFCSRSNGPLLIGGDFNIIRYVEERNRPYSLNRFSDMFNTLINFHELREILMNGGLFTWSNNQEIPILEKLDRILATKDWEDIFPNTIVKKLPREISNHNPLILSIGSYNTQRHLQFRFEKSWLSNPEFLPTVKKIWDKPCRANTTLDKIQQKLKLVKQYFKGWGLTCKES